MAKNFPKLMTDTKPLINGRHFIHEAQIILKGKNIKISIPRHIIFKLYKTKDNDKNLERWH